MVGHFLNQSLWQGDNLIQPKKIFRFSWESSQYLGKFSGVNLMLLWFCGISNLYANIKRVLTKIFFMFIIHRITIQRYIRCNLGFILFSSILLFLGKGNISYSSYVLTKSGNSSF
jgi:hypothetical protein